jgi:putative Holliday junction resolvase
MGRILAIDYGRKRVGLAVTDPLKIIATALDTIEETKVLEFLKNYCTREEVEAFVIGMPKTLNNDESENAKYVKAFSEKLANILPAIPIHFVDERFTSSMALDSMIAGGVKKKDRRVKGNIDKISATIILQSFLEQNRLR